MVMMVMKLNSKIINVETAFLLVTWMRRYMTFDALHEKDEVLLLRHAIYGLVQASRQLWKKYTEKLKKIGFEGGYPDPCLYSRRDEYGVVFLAVLVDDSLLVGDEKTSKESSTHTARNTTPYSSLLEYKHGSGCPHSKPILCSFSTYFFQNCLDA